MRAAAKQFAVEAKRALLQFGLLDRTIHAVVGRTQAKVQREREQISPLHYGMTIKKKSKQKPCATQGFCS